LLQQIFPPVQEQSAGQFPQFSPALQTESPQPTAQLLSFPTLQLLGQQPSPLIHAVIVVFTQLAAHVPALLQESVVQERLSLQSEPLEQAGVTQTLPHKIFPDGQPQSCGQFVWFSPNKLSQPSAPHVGVLEQAEVSKSEQSFLHPSVPTSNPFVTQVWLARAVPSHTSLPLILLFPQV